MSSTTNEYLTVAEAADLLRVSVSTVRRWIRTGTLVAHRAGSRRLLLKRTDLTDAIRTVAPDAEAADRSAGSPVPPWPDSGADHHHTPDDRRRNRSEENGSTGQAAARAEPFDLMVPESWEVIREGRELRTEQLMGEDDPEFDEFDIGVLAGMIVHSPDRPRRRLLTPDEQQQMLSALERSARTRERIRKRSGVDKFPPSEDIIAEMRAERTRQLAGADDGQDEFTT